MAQALLPVSRGYLLAGAVVAAGLYVTHDRGEPSERPAPHIATVEPRQAYAPRAMPTLMVPISGIADDEVVETEDDDIEEVRGLTPLEDVGELALVFDVDGTSYMRLSHELRASARGKARMIVADDVYAVVAPVSASAMPNDLATWNGREVLVNGTCRARIIGFAEVSRVSGDPPGSENYWYSSEEDRPTTPPAWTIATVTADNVTLAAKLDGCDGTWARSADYEPAQIAHNAEAPALETAAIADLLVNDNETLAKEWKDSGGEGDWQDEVDIDASTYEHPVTGDKWIFVTAFEAGGCGEPSLSRMVAYRAGKSGKVQRFADLDYAGRSISDVVDLDGDGQPELLLGAGTTTDLVDLANVDHASISVPVHHYGCGC